MLENQEISVSASYCMCYLKIKTISNKDHKVGKFVLTSSQEHIDYS